MNGNSSNPFSEAFSYEKMWTMQFRNRCANYYIVYLAAVFLGGDFRFANCPVLEEMSFISFTIIFFNLQYPNNEKVVQWSL